MTVVTVKSRRLVARMYALRSRHARLDDAIKAELKRPGACALKLQALKRLRLKAKDDIALLQGRVSRAATA